MTTSKIPKRKSEEEALQADSKIPRPNSKRSPTVANIEASDTASNEISPQRKRPLSKEESAVTKKSRLSE
jgi:hypothetical protein